MCFSVLRCSMCVLCDLADLCVWVCGDVNLDCVWRAVCFWWDEAVAM